MARLEVVKADAGAPSEVFRLLTDAPAAGAKRTSLPDIARLWRVPKGRFVEWFTVQHAEIYDAALKVIAADFAIDAMQEALDATPETVAVAKLRSDVALKLAAKFDRQRFGETVRVEKTVTVGADAGLLGTARDLLRLAATSRLPAMLGSQPVTVIDGEVGGADRASPLETPARLPAAVSGDLI